MVEDLNEDKFLDILNGLGRPIDKRMRGNLFTNIQLQQYSLI